MPDRSGADRGKRGRAILWVAAQALPFFAFLFLLPYPNRSPFPATFRVAGTLLLGGGALFLLIGGWLALGRKMTPLPLPAPGARLVREGLYARIRHPIYGGVLLASLAWALFRGGWAHLAGTALILLFFGAKSRWEEARLRERFPEYEAYERRTGRFFPPIR